MPGSSVVFFAGLLAADPVFVDSASVKVEGDNVTMVIVGEKTIDPVAVSGRITPEGVGIYIDGGMGRPSNLQWQSGGLTIDARRRKDKVKIEMAFPVGTTCTGGVKIRGTEDGKIEAEFKCTAAAGGATTVAVVAEGNKGEPVASIAPAAATGASAEASRVPAVIQGEAVEAVSAQEPLAASTPSNRWMWVLGAQALLIIVLLLRRKPVPKAEAPAVVSQSPSPVSGDPLKVLIVAEMEGRHFLLGASDTHTGLVRDATAKWADQRVVTEVLLTPIGSARSNRNTSSAISESAEERLAAKVFGKTGR